MVEKKLSKECLNLWTAVNWFSYGIFIFLGILGWLIPFLFGAQLLGLLLIPLIIFIIALLTHAYMKAYWKKFHFTYDNDEIRVYSGVWWYKQVIIPFSRITHINLMQGPWQRPRGLSTLKIQTAGRSGDANPESQLWSQKDYENLREDLISKIARTRLKGMGDGTVDTEEDRVTESAADLDTQKEMIAILKQIEKNTKKMTG